ncbi:MAG: hypothetical protein D6796_00100 [Caldilineae bacterium]|nr:MAG: hypothetical protein D6796_00100 [Caldilineae bacterium]
MDAAAPGVNISPYVYGVNHGPWAFMDADMLAQAAQIPVHFIRFPGGNWGDENNLKPWHLDAFIALCRQLDAEPQVSVRLRGGTPEAAAELVRYANLEKGYRIRYWSIGNEPELYASKPGFEGYDVERLNREWRAIAEAMLAVDPDIVLLGPEVTQFTGDPASDPKDRHGHDWMRSFLEANGDLVDIVSIHRYPFPQGMTGGIAAPETLLANAAEWEHIIPALRETIRQTTGRDLPVAVTEVNSYWSNAAGGETTPDSFYSALWWADVLGHLLEQDVQIVSFFSLQSNASIGGYGLFSRRSPRPSYYTYRLYNQFGDRRLPVQYDDSRLSFYAARRADGALSLLVINRSAERLQKVVQIAGARPEGQARLWLFDAGHAAEEQSPLPWDAETTVVLPPYSATLFVIPLVAR